MPNMTQLRSDLESELNGLRIARKQAAAQRDEARKRITELDAEIKTAERMLRATEPRKRRSKAEIEADGG